MQNENKPVIGLSCGDVNGIGLEIIIKTVADTTKDLYNVQKMTKDLKGPDPDSDPRKKNAESINVEQAVFVGSAAELLSAIKKKREDGENTV